MEITLERNNFKMEVTFPRANDKGRNQDFSNSHKLNIALSFISRKWKCDRKRKDEKRM